MSNRIPYTWISIDKAAPLPLERVLAVWDNGQFRMIVFSCMDEYGVWHALGQPTLPQYGWTATHWQYLPALPE